MKSSLESNSYRVEVLGWGAVVRLEKQKERSVVAAIRLQSEMEH